MAQYPNVLAFCNGVRDRLGRQSVPRLRKGVRGDPTYCPVAATINYGARKLVEIDAAQVEFAGPVYNSGTPIGPIAETPRLIKDFLEAFDTGELPELEGQGWAA